MGSEKTVLVVCRSLSEICLLQGLQVQPDCRYIVASDDLRVHREIGKYPWVAEVCYLEQMESLYAVAADVIKYLELINQWLTSLGNNPEGVPKELLFWLRVCEGGVTTQRIQDLLLLIRSYQYLIDTYNVSSIVILRHPYTKWEDDILIKISQSKDIKVKIVGGFRLSVLKARLLVWMKLLAREPYYITYILRAKLWGHLRSHTPEISEQEIVMQMCIPHDKFVEEHVIVMKALTNLGYDPVALLWRASKAATKFQREGLWVEQLETFIPLASIWKAPCRVWSTWRQARNRRREFLTHPGLQYHNIALGPLLWPSVVAFFWEELSQRYRLQQAAKKYFASHAPRAMRLWGGGLLAEGRIVSEILNNPPRPLLFLWVGLSHEDPYYEPPRSALFLAAGDDQKEYLKKVGVPSGCIVKVGSSRFEHLPAFRQKYTPFQSRAHLDIPQDFQNYILFDSNDILRGYTTIQEQSLVTSALLNFAREHPSVALMIKPHPAYRSGWLEVLLDYFSSPNVFLVDKKMVPLHALNAADLLITKFSTIALEAMLFQKPVISILLDGEDRFRIFGDAVEEANNLEELLEILTMVISDADRRADWVARQIAHQKIFMKKYFGNNVSESAKIGVAAVDKFLKDKALLREIEA